MSLKNIYYMFVHIFLNPQRWTFCIFNLKGVVGGVADVIHNILSHLKTYNSDVFDKVPISMLRVSMKKEWELKKIRGILIEKIPWKICIGPILDDRLKEKILKPWKGVLCIHFRVCLPVCICVCLSVCVSVCPSVRLYAGYGAHLLT